MRSVLSSASEALVLLIRCLVSTYTFITLPLYYVIQKPWRVKANYSTLRARPLNHGEEDFVVYRSVTKISDVHAKFIQDKLDTMEKVFCSAVSQHKNKPALGTRVILSEEDEIQPDGKIFKKFLLGGFQWRTYTQMNDEAENFGRGLRELGLKPFENVVIFAETRAEWLISANGCMKQNMPIVTLYASLGDDALIHGINETDVSCVVTSQQLLEKFKNILPSTKNVNLLIVMEDPLKPLELEGYGDAVRVRSYQEVIRRGSEASKSGKFSGVLHSPKPGDTAIIMYTSGSTGAPKGVIMSHQNIVNAMLSYTDVGPLYKNDVYMAFLPLAHVLEFISESLWMLFGIPIGYSTPLTMTDESSKIQRGCQGDASVLRPTIIACVPLVLDRIQKKIKEKIEGGPAYKKAIFNLAMEYKNEWIDHGYDTPILNSTLFKPIRAFLGGRIRFVLSGGAPLAPETHKFMKTTLCCPVLQGYGLTETCAATTLMDFDDNSWGTTGGPLTCCDIKLVSWVEGDYRVNDWPNPRGEIHIGGSNVAVGYFKQPEKTSKAFYEENGRRWFRTGDIGEFTQEGFLKVIDRQKDLVKLQHGEYVSLGKVESELKINSLVDNICIYADPTKMFPVALLVPNFDQLKNLAEKSGIELATIEDVCNHPRRQQMEQLVLKELQKHAVKCRLQKFEVPQALTLLSDIWTPDSGLVTAAFKLKRKNIQDHYQFLINRMYS
ncbi:long-chain-fatty-acid--CoA ligase 4-like [Daphnia pulicaria]|uniref:long-chain-fatty-acid--CoA ligase 4-like n=1 Tax=Daphnia pulicaria TaxID=35523 RepID=UPI001EEA5663|nr:long-chain-fatty-acid--CoA ligase 4-like [Daphnia pulicaria]